MRINKMQLLLCIAVPLGIGGLASLLTVDQMEAFAILNKPPLSPPAWLFPIAWTALYVLMGFASYGILQFRSQPGVKKALSLYVIQLGVNFFWTILFFNMSLYFLSFVWLCMLWVLILLMFNAFYGISHTAGYMLIPYLLWVSFAGYLNFAISMIN